MSRNRDAVVQIRSDRSEYRGNAYTNSTADIRPMSNADGYHRCKYKNKSGKNLREKKLY